MLSEMERELDQARGQKNANREDGPPLKQKNGFHLEQKAKEIRRSRNSACAWFTVAEHISY
jgi:hypothetical protein